MKDPNYADGIMDGITSDAIKSDHMDYRRGWVDIKQLLAGRLQANFRATRLPIAKESEWTQKKLFALISGFRFWDEDKNETMVGNVWTLEAAYRAIIGKYPVPESARHGG